MMSSKLPRPANAVSSGLGGGRGVYAQQALGVSKQLLGCSRGHAHWL